MERRRSKYRGDMVVEGRAVQFVVVGVRRKLRLVVVEGQLDGKYESQKH